MNAVHGEGIIPGTMEAARIACLIAGAIAIIVVLIDAFETILQPRRVVHRFRLARLYYRNAWLGWRYFALLLRGGKLREAALGIFGPISLLGLFVIWVCGLILGFALFYWGASLPMATASHRVTPSDYLYLSGTTFFTLGPGDVTPIGALGRALMIVESGLGFGFLAIIISYLPVLSQAYSRREVAISLLDARAGSPPSAGQLLARLGRAGSLADVNWFLAEWEAWSAELLESHLSFPVLSYFRSQHDNQSWLAALTTMLDTSALLMAEIRNFNPYRAQLTFAMARHSAVDLTLILKLHPEKSAPDRLPADRRGLLETALAGAGLELHEKDAGEKLNELRGMYEPFLWALARRFSLTLPPFLPEGEPVDNWQRSPGMRAPGLGKLAVKGDGHFG